MVIERFTFFRDETSTGDSNVWFNFNHGSALTLEVTGTASSKTIVVEGIVGEENETTWTTLAVINGTSFDVTSSITANGIYNIGIDGVYRIRVSVDAISGGNVSVIGKMSN